MTRVLFVCTGNICRSPMAEGILRKKLRDLGLEDKFEVDSCGTGGWHMGESADHRTEKVLAQYDSGFQHAARKLTRQGEHFDYIFAMDEEHLSHPHRNFPDSKHKIKLILDYIDGGEVPDPYYGNLGDFEAVYVMLEEAIEVFVKEVIQKNHS